MENSKWCAAFLNSHEMKALTVITNFSALLTSGYQGAENLFLLFIFLIYYQKPTGLVGIKTSSLDQWEQPLFNAIMYLGTEI